jgi:hypothetical protein
MKKQLLSLMAIIGLATASATPVLADDLETLEGSWTAQKTTDEGQRVSQQIEIKKNKFKLKIMDRDGQTRLYAEGDVKLDKAGPFKTMIFSNIKAGESDSDLSPIEDTYTSIYRIGEDNTWTLLTNFDKDRDQQKPSLDTYRKSKETASSKAK